MNESRGYFWYRLLNTRGLGPKGVFYVYQHLCNSLITEEDVFELDWGEFRCRLPGLGKGIFEELRKADDERYLEYQGLLQSGVSIIHLGHELYPSRLIALLGNKSPPILFCSGELSLLNARSVSIEGSRDASEEGLSLSSRFAAELALRGFNVVSGYARGIDTNAHLGALMEDGTTTIVLSFGICAFSKKKVFEDVRWEGNILVVSQFHPTEVWRVRNAMARNELVNALSEAVVIVEAAENGGTFNSGKVALKCGLPLFVVAPDAFEKVPVGNQRLICMGAQTITPSDGMSELISTIESNRCGARPDVSSEQLPLFVREDRNGN